MEKKQLTIEKSIATVRGMIIIITETVINWHSNRCGILFTVRKQPLYIAIISIGHKRILHISGEEIPYDDFAAKYPEAGNMIDNLK